MSNGPKLFLKKKKQLRCPNFNFCECMCVDCWINRLMWPLRLRWCSSASTMHLFQCSLQHMKLRYVQRIVHFYTDLQRIRWSIDFVEVLETHRRKRQGPHIAYILLISVIYWIVTIFYHISKTFFLVFKSMINNILKYCFPISLPSIPKKLSKSLFF